MIEAYRPLFSFLYGIPWDTDYTRMPYHLWNAYRVMADQWRDGKLRR